MSDVITPPDTARFMADFIYDLKYEALGSEVTETTKLFIADYTAACYAGRRINRQFNEALLKIYGDTEITENRAYMNAVYAHGADMDDGNRKAMGHVAAHVMSSVFALAEELKDRTWKDIFTAINAGYEVYNRIGAMAQPGLVRRGFHSTGTAGVIAAAGACAKLLNCSKDEIYNALGIAAIQASGLLIIAESAQCCKPLNPAAAARNGIISARLAKAGVPGPIRPFESEKGWFHAMTDKVHYEMLDGLGSAFTICESYLKPYPSCRHTHCGIEAAVYIHNEMKAKGLTVSDINKLKLYIYGNAIRIAGQIRKPDTVEDRKFSIHFTLAAAICTGAFTLDDLENDISEEVIKMIDLIELIPDETMEDGAAGIRGARLCVGFNDRTVMEKTVFLPKGEAANPFTWDDMYQKMSDCAKGFGIDAGAVCEQIQSIDPEERYSRIDGSPEDIMMCSTHSSCALCFNT
ncbi:MAG: MmgE/PrpD family protein [Lachnospiraceae bacterium]|nr:MmgE/PrpD family protein [Lachnospiraceae bacterium]